MQWDKEIIYDGVFILLNIFILLLINGWLKNIILKPIFRPDVKLLYEGLYRAQGRNGVRADSYKHKVIDFEEKRILTLNIFQNGKVSYSSDAPIVYRIDHDDFKYFTNNNSSGEIAVQNFDPAGEVRELNFDIFTKYKLKVINNETVRLVNKTNESEYVDIKLTPGYQVDQNSQDQTISVNRRSPCNNLETICRVRYGDYVTFYARLINPEIEVPEWGSELYNEKARNLRWLCENEQDLRPKLRQCQIDMVEINEQKKYTC